MVGQVKVFIGRSGSDEEEQIFIFKLGLSCERAKWLRGSLKSAASAKIVNGQQPCLPSASLPGWLSMVLIQIGLLHSGMVMFTAA